MKPGDDLDEQARGLLVIRATLAYAAREISALKDPPGGAVAAIAVAYAELNAAVEEAIGAEAAQTYAKRETRALQ